MWMLVILYLSLLSYSVDSPYFLIRLYYKILRIVYIYFMLHILHLCLFIVYLVYNYYSYLHNSMSYVYYYITYYLYLCSILLLHYFMSNYLVLHLLSSSVLRYRMSNLLYSYLPHSYFLLSLVLLMPLYLHLLFHNLSYPPLPSIRIPYLLIS